MSTLAQVLNAFAALVGTDVGSLRTKMGDLTTLTTTEKTNLVGALNEVKASLSTFAQDIIDDEAASATSTYSSTKVTQLIQAAVDGIVDGAPEAYNTLQEIAAYIAADETATSALLTAVNNRVRYDEVMTLTEVQIQNVWTTLELGDRSTLDLEGAYTAARDA